MDAAKSYNITISIKNVCKIIIKILRNMQVFSNQCEQLFPPVLS